MRSRRIFIGKVASGLAGAIAAPNVLAAGDRIRFGIIGPGDRGTQMLREALACPNAEIAGIYTKRLEDAQAITHGPEAETLCFLLPWR
ncbi:MAG: hypothetical protein ABSF54_13850 [Bryobacteraceae bacterium]